MDSTILVITPINHIEGVRSILEKGGKLIYREDPSHEEVNTLVPEVDAIFTNPNKSDVYISEGIMQNAQNLDVICTASTGTNHIDKEYASEKGIDIISLKEEREAINKISSTAEHAFGLMMCGIRNIPQAWESVKDGKWDYQPFLGRQLNFLTVGVVGYGRLGTYFSDYCLGFNCDVIVYDPYKEINKPDIKQVQNLEILLTEADVISFHVHLNSETEQMFDEECFAKMKEDVVIVNTSRGEIVDDQALIDFLSNNPEAYYATDVLSGEIEDVEEHPLRKYAVNEGVNQTIITPHLGTTDGQRIAFQHAANLLIEHLES